MKSSSRTRRFGDLTRPILDTILYWKIQHFALRLSPKMSRNAVPATKSHTPTSPNTVPATQNESHHWSASHMKRHLQCAEQPESPSNLTKYCACHAKWISWLIRVTYETSFTMRGASTVSLQPHQILRLPRNINLMIDPRHIWNVIYNARSNTGYCPTSPNTAPATKFWVQDVSGKSLNCFRQYKDDSSMIRAWSEHDPKIKSSSCTRRFGDLTRPILETHFVWKNTTFRAPAISQNCTKCCACHEKSHSNFTKYCACHAKWISWIDPRHIWNVIYKARSNQSHPPTSPNTAPATQNESHDWSASHMKRHLQCAEQAQSASNLTKYCAVNCFRQYKDDSTTFRPWSEDKIVISHPPLRRPYSSDLGNDFVLKNTTFRAPAISQNCTKCCACHEKSHSNFTKYCACHAKWISWHLFSLGIYSLSASILSRHLFSLGIYSLSASILSWHLFSLGIYSLLASILSWHLFSLGIYSLSASILSWHLFSLGIYSLLAPILSWHLFSLGIYSLSIFKTS